MKTILFLLCGMLSWATACAQTSIQTGNTQFVTDTSALFQPYVYNNMDTTMPTTVWIKLLSPITDSLGATTTFPRNFSFNFLYHDLICGSTQSYIAGFQNSDTTVSGNIQSFTLLPCTGIHEEKMLISSINIAPMPVVSVSRITDDDAVAYVIYDMTGMLVRSLTNDHSSVDIDHADFAAGMYLCVALDRYGTAIGRTKMIIE